MRSIDVLLVRSRGWLVGIDAAHVTHIARPTVGAGDVIDLATVLGGTHETSRAQPRARWLTLRDGRIMAVDAALETMTMRSTRLQRLPPTLRHFGAPEWWLGTTSARDELVLLVDILGALEGRA